MPISGRFSTTSIRLPTHIDATRPQNSEGLDVITCGPGWMLWMVIAPTISAITAFSGMPSVSSGMNEVCAPALLADSGTGDAFDRALAEAAGVLGDFLLDRIGGERREHRAAAGQQAQHRAERGAAQHRRQLPLATAAMVSHKPLTLASPRYLRFSP